MQKYYNDVASGIFGELLLSYVILLELLGKFNVVVFEIIIPGEEWEKSRERSSKDSYVWTEQ